MDNRRKKKRARKEKRFKKTGNEHEPKWKKSVIEPITPPQ